MTTQDTAGAPKDDYALGVLVVHGIGDQKQGATLTAWVDALTMWIRRLQQPAGRNVVNRAQISRAHLTPKTGPAHVVLDLQLDEPRAGHRDDNRQRWLFAEGWWAGTFEPPSFGELWSWSFLSVPATAAMHANALMRGAVRRYRSSKGAQAVLEAMRLVTTVIFLLFLVMISPVVLVLFTALLVLGLLASLLPITAVRQAILKAQLIAVGTLGDTKRLVDSPVQAGAIKSPVAAGIQWLRDQGAQRVVILSHSQGAAVTYKTLVDVGNGLHGDMKKIDSFISVGSGLPKVHALEYLSSKSGRLLHAASLAVPAAAVTSALSVRWLQQRDALQGLWGMAVVAVIVLALAAVRMMRTNDDNPTGDEPRRIPRSPFAVGAIAAVAWSFFVDEGLVTLIATAGLVVGIACTFIIATRRIPPVPEGLDKATERWIDLFAAADPVPAGPTRTAREGRPISWRVTNLGSIARDHNAYTGNDDECLTYVGTELFDSANIRVEAEQLREAAAVFGLQRRWRVGWRVVLSYLLTAAGVMLAWRTWDSADDSVARGYKWLLAEDNLIQSWFPGDLPGFVPTTISLGAAQTIAIVLFIFVTIVFVQIGQAAWRAWNTAEVERRLTDDENPDPPIAFGVMIGVLVFAWFIAVLPHQVWDAWKAVDLTSWTDVLLLLGTIAMPVLMGRLVPRLLERSGFKAFMMGRDTSRIEGLIGYGNYQLARGRTDVAIEAFERSLDASRQASHASAAALGGLGRAKVQRAGELRVDADASDGETRNRLVAEADWLDRSALTDFTSASRLPRLVTSSTLLAYANHVVVAGDGLDEFHHRRLISWAARRDPESLHVLIARVAHGIEPNVLLRTSDSVTDYPTALRETAPMLTGPDELLARFVLLVHDGPGDGEQPNANRSRVIELLQNGVRYREADLRVPLAHAGTLGWSTAEIAELRSLGAQIRDLAEVPVSSAPPADATRETANA